MKSQERPFDSLSGSIGSQITIKLKDGLVYTGELISFDIHLNVVLSNAIEKMVDEKVENLSGKVLIRGDMISTIKEIN